MNSWAMQRYARVGNTFIDNNFSESVPDEFEKIPVGNSGINLTLSWFKLYDLNPMKLLGFDVSAEFYRNNARKIPKEIDALDDEKLVFINIPDVTPDAKVASWIVMNQVRNHSHILQTEPTQQAPRTLMNAISVEVAFVNKLNN